MLRRPSSSTKYYIEEPGCLPSIGSAAEVESLLEAHAEAIPSRFPLLLEPDNSSMLALDVLEYLLDATREPTVVHTISANCAYDLGE